MTIGALLLAVVVMFAPHPDDEVTMMPQAQAASANIVIVTDGADTGHCNPVAPFYGPGRRTAECKEMRAEATRQFVGDTCPACELEFAGIPDGTLTLPKAEAVIDFYCAPSSAGGRTFWFDWGNEPPQCEMHMAGATEVLGYMHPDHLVLRDAVVASGGDVWDGVPYWDQAIYDSAVVHYGWLLSAAQWPLVGLDTVHRGTLPTTLNTEGTDVLTK